MTPPPHLIGSLHLAMAPQFVAFAPFQRILNRTFIIGTSIALVSSFTLVRRRSNARIPAVRAAHTLHHKRASSGGIERVQLFGSEPLWHQERPHRYQC